MQIPLVILKEIENKSDSLKKLVEEFVYLRLVVELLQLDFDTLFLILYYLIELFTQYLLAFLALLIHLFIYFLYFAR